jgi:uncharacterized oxidoreductase
MVKIKHTELQELLSKIFLKKGASHNAAQQVARSFVYADLMGFESHGLAMVYRYLEMIDLGWIRPEAKPSILKETSNSILINGNWAFGQVAFNYGFDLAKEKAKESGIACVSARNSGHCGRLGQYPERMANESLIGIAMINNHGAGNMVAPFGGTERRLSTNPIAIAIPTNNKYPLLLDMTTSVVAERKLKLKHLSGEKVEKGWFISHDGSLSTNTEDFYSDPVGALLPFGGSVGYKGYGLSVIIDILAGALSGAGCSNPNTKQVGNALFGIVIDPGKLNDNMYEHINNLLEYLKSSKLSPGTEQIYYPGEIEFNILEKRQKEGLSYNKDVIKLLKKSVASVGLKYKLG